jgi:3-oxoacyl-[acyl-carrier-protein] synthase-3
MIKAKITGTGLGVPSRVVTNHDMAKIVDTNDEWIRTRTGISERRFTDPTKGEFNTQLGVMACNEALRRAGVLPQDVDFIVCATTTPDTTMPITGARIAHAIGALRAGSVDCNSACTGFLVALHMGEALIQSGKNKKVLVVATEIFQHILDFTDRATCVLFGDGCGAVLLEPVEVSDPRTESHILGSFVRAELDTGGALVCEGGGVMFPYGQERGFRNGKPYIQMSGQDVFKMATRCMADAAKEILTQTGYSINDVDWFVPHQANKRIIEMVGKLLNFPSEKTFVNVDRWGNTSAATVAICLAEMNQQNLLKKGQLVLLDVFGGGFTYGAALIRW